MKQGSALTRTVMVVVLLAILVYIIASSIRSAMDPYSYVTAYGAAVDDAISVTGWVFRREAALPPTEGLYSLQVEEGEKTAAGQALAVLYQDENVLQRQAEEREMSAQIKEVDYALSDAAVSGSTLEEQLMDSLKSLRTAALDGSYGKLVAQGENFRQLVLRREYLYADYTQDAPSHLSQARSSLAARLAELQNQNLGEVQSVIAPAAGFFSAHVDGWESILDPVLLDNLTPQDLDNLTAASPTPPAGLLGKLVTGSVWYLAFSLPEGEEPLFEEGNDVSVRLSSQGKELPMQVYHKSLVQDGRLVVVLRSNRSMEEVMTLRESACSVIFTSSQGIMVPKTALRVVKEQTGVFALTGGRAEFKPVSVLMEGDDFYLVKAAPRDGQDKRVLRTGDQVIIAETDLYDGKVVR